MGGLGGWAGSLGIPSVLSNSHHRVTVHAGIAGTDVQRSVTADEEPLYQSGFPTTMLRISSE